jgi:tRNA pseudouridine38-40 synthase
MGRFRLTIEYVGTRYRGWQIQKNARTVQGELRRAVAEGTGQQTFELYGAGRTDAGVHALCQVAHLDLAAGLTAERLRFAINDALPPDINVIRVEPAPHRFHARHGAVARSYLYQVSRRRTAFAKPFVWWVRDPLDVGRMRAAAAPFVGLKDFRSFSATDPEEASTRVQVDHLEIVEEGELILIRIRGSHFLWKMVRRLVGVLVGVGRGDLKVEQVEGFLRERSPIPAELTAPPSGLFLERVFYEGEETELPLRPAVPVGVSWLGGEGHARVRAPGGVSSAGHGRSTRRARRSARRSRP